MKLQFYNFWQRFLATFFCPLVFLVIILNSTNSSFEQTGSVWDLQIKSNRWSNSSRRTVHFKFTLIQGVCPKTNTYQFALNFRLTRLQCSLRSGRFLTRFKRVALYYSRELFFSLSHSTLTFCPCFRGEWIHNAVAINIRILSATPDDTSNFFSPWRKLTEGEKFRFKEDDQWKATSISDLL